MNLYKDLFGARTTFDTGNGPATMFALLKLEKDGIAEVSRLPYAIKVLLESLLRGCDGQRIARDDVVALARWPAEAAAGRELAFMPARVLLHDFTGVPSVVDLAALRSAMERMGGDPRRINPLVPADVVIDHSVQVDAFGTTYALSYNAEREFERNRERYEFLRWGRSAFENFCVVPPATGIVHQVNLEYLAKVVQTRQASDQTVAFPDSLVGTDSHTTMINGLGVLGWGVGGIEAEAVLLDQPYYMLAPQVVGFKLTGALPEGATATDLVLTVTQMLRAKGVVGKFVEFYGPGVSRLSLPDRATVANMSPEYGATVGFFPVDEETLRYLAGTGRDEAQVELVERYTKEQGLFRTDASIAPVYSEALELDMATVEPSLAGPKRPQDRVPLRQMKSAFKAALTAPTSQRGFALDEAALDRTARLEQDGQTVTLRHGSVAIAAITSCTNTSNPSVMIGAGLLAKKAVERGLSVKPYVKTSLAPGSRVVTDYLSAAGLMPYLEALRFHVIGYGCTTCVGNSGSLPEPIANAVQENGLVVAAVLSGNRNFEGRINPLTQACYLASPLLVVAYALAGRVDVDLANEPLSDDPNGQPVYLRDIWPTQEEIEREVRRSLGPDLFRRQYATATTGNETWNQIAVPEGDLYAWEANSTYIQEPPFFVDLTLEPPSPSDIAGARVLALLGDSVTTDHISPAGAIPADGPAGRYLIGRGVTPRDLNSFGSRRGNHEVMMRGTFGNIRLKNLLLPGTEGSVTVYLPTGEQMSIYDAAMRYKAAGTSLLVIAGKEYGAGSSRDWAAKGARLLGVRAVLVESYERIHRSNLVGMGVLPLQFQPGESAASLGLDGHETYDVKGITDLQPGQEIAVHARAEGGKETAFTALVRIDSPVEMEYYGNGGILQTVLRNMLKAEMTR